MEWADLLSSTAVDDVSVVSHTADPVLEPADFQPLPVPLPLPVDEQPSLVSQPNHEPEMLFPGPSSGANRKRRRGISPEQRVQRQRFSLEEGVTALSCLDPDQQQAVEMEAARGIHGSHVIHRCDRNIFLSFI